MIIKKRTETVCKIILPSNHDLLEAVQYYMTLNELDRIESGWHKNQILKVVSFSEIYEFLKNDNSDFYEFVEEGWE